MIPGLERFKNTIPAITIHTNKESPQRFYSIKQLETQIFRYNEKRELTIELMGDYLLSLKPWIKKKDADPIDWKWSGFLSQEGYHNGIMLRLDKQLFLDDVLLPEEFIKKPVHSPLIHRVISSIQSGREHRNQNLFYLLNPNFK